MHTIACTLPSIAVVNIRGRLKATFAGSRQTNGAMWRSKNMTDLRQSMLSSQITPWYIMTNIAMEKDHLW